MIIRIVLKLRRLNFSGTFLRSLPESKSKAGNLRSEGGIVSKLGHFFNVPLVSGTFRRCLPESKSKADSFGSDLLISFSYKATSSCVNSFFISLHLPLEYPYTSSRFFIMKYLPTIFSLVALIALVPALVAAGDGESNDSDDLSGDRHHPHDPRPTQVLWGQCTFIFCIGYQTNSDIIYPILGGGYYYSGTNLCPKGAYCRYFSDCEFPWFSLRLIHECVFKFSFFSGYSQCNLNGQ